MPLAKSLYSLLFVILCLMLASCSPTSLLNIASRSSHYRVAEDIAYGDDPRQKMDEYLPSPGSEATQSCDIVFVYGGSWDTGSKDQYGFVAAAFVRLGYRVFVPDYRLYPQVTFPGFVEDVASAITFIENNKRKTSSPPLVLIGHSAGALNAAHVAFDGSYLKAHGLNPGTLSAYIGISGPHDYFLPSEKASWKAIFGDDPKQQVSALTVNHIGDVAPVTLILHGQNDKVVTPRSAHSLASALESHGHAVTLRTYPGVGHRRIIAALTPGLHFLAPTLEDIDTFLEQEICGGQVSQPH